MMRKNKRGAVLIIVLWMLAILAIAAAGLGRQTSVEIALAKYRIRKVQAKYAAWAGFIRAVDRIRGDTEDPNSAAQDNMFACGIRLDDGETPETFFKDVKVGEGSFEVMYVNPDTGLLQFGMADEERRLNLNALQPYNYGIFRNLLILAGVNESRAAVIAASAQDWRDEDDTVTGGAGAEDGYYTSLPNGYHCKNRPFDHIEELLMVRGMTPEIFDRIKGYVTVFPKTGNLAVNFDTAPAIVLRAVVRSLAGAVTNTDVSDADSLVDKMIAYRAGMDNQHGTDDDVMVDAGMSLNQKENVIFLSAFLNRTPTSKYLRIRVTGTAGDTGVTSEIDAVVERSSLGIVQWTRK